MENKIDFEAPDVDFEEAPELEPADMPDDSPEQSDEPSNKDELLTIYDALLFEGAYSEIYSLGKRYSVRYRSRTAEEETTILRQLDGMKYNTVQAYQSMSAMSHLAYSLTDYCGKDLTKMDVKDRYDFVSGLPTQVLEILSTNMVDFDSKLQIALEYGKENF